jgi:hypothetical protein
VTPNRVGKEPVEPSSLLVAEVVDVIHRDERDLGTVG